MDEFHKMMEDFFREEDALGNEQEADEEEASYLIHQFCVGFDNRPFNWDYDQEEDQFPYSPDFTLVFELRGEYLGQLKPGQSLRPRFDIYSGDSTNDGDILDSVTSRPIAVSTSRQFYQRIVSEITLTRPRTRGEVDTYTVELNIEGHVYATRTIHIVNHPLDLHDLIRVEQMMVKHDRAAAGTVDINIDMIYSATTALSTVADISCYLSCGNGDTDFFCDGAPCRPLLCIRSVSLSAGQRGRLGFFFTEIPKSVLQAKDLMFYITQGSNIFLKIPGKLVLSGEIFNEQALSDYYVTSKFNKPDAQPDFPGRDPSVDISLEPQSLKDFLVLLDKTHRYCERRSDFGHTTNWHLRPLIFVGKKGTGKNEAARKLSQRMKSYGLVQGYSSIEALSLFDPNTGFSPQLEAKLDDLSNNVIVINNAESLAIKGNPNSLSGIEILANKLKDQKDVQVILTGRKGPIEEMINSCDQARETFDTFFDFEDVTPQQMLQKVLLRLYNEGYTTTEGARQRLRLYFERAYNLRSVNFSNMHFATKTVDDEIFPNIVRRTIDADLNVTDDLNLVTEDDIPQLPERNPEPALKKLEKLVGLETVKKRILEHTSLVRLNKLRSEHRLYNRMPPMHMVFTGNPGTGKTTIAKYLGEIYHGIGVLSTGHMVETDRSKLVGQYIGDTEKNTLNAIQRAAGGVLFIDEAYNLFVEQGDKRDFGMRVIETLLTYLAMEDGDMIVILAGYTNEMKQMLESNPGLKSRFPYQFHFDDYSPEQLLNIGKIVLEREQYRLTPEAEQALSRYIINEYNHKDEHFGNGRFITRLLTSHVIPAVSKRIMDIPANQITKEMLCTIEVADIPSHSHQRYPLLPVDETILTDTLSKLDKLVGIANAKRALHDYVTVSRLERQNGTLNADPRKLSWNFIGSTGTGKSTVAGLLAKLLQGLGLLKRGHIVVLNAEELAAGDLFATIEKALKRAADGLLFMDMDSPRYKDQPFDVIRLWIKRKLSELGQTTAVVFAEATDGNEAIMKNLAGNGISSLYHSIIFNDFTVEELTGILRLMLSEDYSLGLTAEAEAELSSYVASVRSNASRNNPVNARTVQMLARTVAQVAQLRIASQPGAAPQVELADVDSFEWNRASSPRIGF